MDNEDQNITMLCMLLGGYQQALDEEAEKRIQLSSHIDADEAKELRLQSYLGRRIIIDYHNTNLILNNFFKVIADNLDYINQQERLKKMQKIIGLFLEHLSIKDEDNVITPTNNYSITISHIMSWLEREQIRRKEKIDTTPSLYDYQNEQLPNQIVRIGDFIIINKLLFTAIAELNVGNVEHYLKTATKPNTSTNAVNTQNTNARWDEISDSSSESSRRSSASSGCLENNSIDSSSTHSETSSRRSSLY